MIKIKEFFENYTDLGRMNDLDKQINEFLANKNVEYINVKYSHQVYSKDTMVNGSSYYGNGSCALLIYRLIDKS